MRAKPRPAPGGSSGGPGDALTLGDRLRAILAWFKMPLLHWSRAEMIDAAIGALVPFPGERVIELGCGTGDAVNRLIGIAHLGRIVGVEPSRTLLQRAIHDNRHAIAAGVAAFSEGPYDALPFDDRSFDGALVIDAIHTWPSPGGGLGEVRRVLRQMGRIVIAIRLTNRAEAEARVAQAQAGLALAGFARIETRESLGYPYPVSLIVARRPD